MTTMLCFCAMMNSRIYHKAQSIRRKESLVTSCVQMTPVDSISQPRNGFRNSPIVAQKWLFCGKASEANLGGGFAPALAGLALGAGLAEIWQRLAEIRHALGGDQIGEGFIE